jgi:hypothetical protein
MDEWKEYEGKRVFIQLKNQRQYSGIVIIANNSFVKIKDKYGMKVSFSTPDISVIEEQQ